MKICFKCEKWDKERSGCREDMRNMEIVCLLRIFLWNYFQGSKKVTPLIDKLNKEMDEGEEWKKS